MVLNRIRQSLSNNNGATTPMLLAIYIAIILFFIVLFEFIYTEAHVNRVEEACRSVVESVLIANAETSYQAKRDGYAGVWHLDDGEVSDSIVSIDPQECLAEQLHLIRDGEDLIKMDGDKQIYRLRDIALTIQNPEFQNDSTPLTSTLSLTVDVSLKFPLIESYPVSVPVKVSAAWNPKY